MMFRVTALALLTALLTTSAAFGMGKPSVAALQVALRARGTYLGTIDGVRGPGTKSAVAAFQRRAGLAADGLVGPRTRAALGRRGRPRLGTRDITFGTVGWDVASLQFLLAWHGFPSGALDGAFGAHTKAALLAFQRWAGIDPIAVAGPQTLAALRQPPPASPVRISAPIDAEPTDGFGPRGMRFHTGIDYPAPLGTPVVAARDGVVAAVGTLAGYGNVVELAHGQGVTTLYAHLSSTFVEPGKRVARGTVVGLVGRTGDATGPHLHFELRLRGAAIDPAGALS